MVIMPLSPKRLLPFLLVSLLLLSGCGPLFFHPKKQFYDNPATSRFFREDVFFKTADGLALHAWFIRSKPEPHATILVLHGNAENLSTHVNSVLWLVKEGFNVFIFDYRGYGRSEGKASIQGVHLDADAALQTALTLTPDRKVIVLGQSIGGAIAVYTVANSLHKDRIAALVIDSPFAGYRLIAREKLSQICLTWPLQYPLSFLFNDAYSPVKRIAQISPVPLLIIHGRQDGVVPVHHGRMLYDAASNPKEFWETAGAGHVRAFQDAGIREKFILYLTARLMKTPAEQSKQSYKTKGFPVDKWEKLGFNY